MHGWVDTARVLVNAGARVEERGGGCETPMHLAAAGGHRVLIKTLFDLGASSNANTDKSETQLHLACAQGALDCVSER